MFYSKYVIITAGGRGVRMQSELPKQFLEINGKPILRYTIELFLSLPFEIGIILVLGSDMLDYWKDYCVKNDFNIRHTLVSGGITRFHSVKRGLRFVPEGTLVAIHDGVRPLISRDFLESMFDKASNHQAVIPTLKISDSMREVMADGTSRVVDREKYRIVQTPQIFHSEILHKSYKQPYIPNFTDDASVVEKAGYEIFEHEGSRLNIKITTPEDLELAKAIIEYNGAVITL